MYETLVPIDYATKDYEGFLQLMQDLIPTLLPEWTDRSNSDFGIVLLQLAAYGLHVLSYHQDKAMNENFLSTARNRESIVKLCRFLGYELARQVPSSVTLTFTKYTASAGLVVTIPAGTKVSTSPLLGNVIYFETDSELVLGAGTHSGLANATQKFSYKDVFLGLGTGIANQEILIEKENILIDDTVKESLTINNLRLYTIENNVTREWTKVSDFLDSTSVDRHYKAVIEGNFYTKIIFGNGTNGMAVPVNSPIYGTYAVGGGVAGNVGANKIVYIYDDFTGVSDIETVTNASSATGGLNFESVETARVLAPKLYSTMNRAVTKADFCAIAEGVDGIAKATLVETFNLDNEVELYLIPSDYGTVSASVKTAVENAITEIMVLNTKLTIYDTTYVNYYVDATVEITDEYVNTTKQKEIEDYLNEILSPQYYSHGEVISTSYIVGAIHKITGVKKATVSAYIEGATPTEDLTITATQFLMLNTLTVTVTGGI